MLYRRKLLSFVYMPPTSVCIWWICLNIFIQSEFRFQCRSTSICTSKKAWNTVALYLIFGLPNSVSQVSIKIQLHDTPLPCQMRWGWAWMSFVLTTNALALARQCVYCSKAWKWNSNATNKNTCTCASEMNWLRQVKASVIFECWQQRYLTQWHSIIFSSVINVAAPNCVHMDWNVHTKYALYHALCLLHKHVCHRIPLGNNNAANKP